MSSGPSSRINQTARGLFSPGLFSDTKSLSQGEIHLWQLDLRNSQCDGLSSVLSRDERQRANRFRYANLRKNFSRMRIALRLILGGYVDASPDRIRFSYTKWGKPEIAGSGVFFSVSHSGNIGLVAVALCPVGVDIELITDSKPEEAGIVAIVCHETERAELNIVSVVERGRLFYQLWTRKEAYCKAIGVGLQYGLTDLFFQSRRQPFEYQVCDSRYGRLPYYVHDIACPLGYVGSICVPFTTTSIQCSTVVANQAGRAKCETVRQYGERSLSDWLDTRHGGEPD